MTDDDTCPDCGKYLDECECEEESVMDDLHDLADLANKGADAYNKWKNILNPPSPKIPTKIEKYDLQKTENSNMDNELKARKRYKTSIILASISIGIGIGGYVIAFVL